MSHIKDNLELELCKHPTPLTPPHPINVSSATWRNGKLLAISSFFFKFAEKFSRNLLIHNPLLM